MATLVIELPRAGTPEIEPTPWALVGADGGMLAEGVHPLDAGPLALEPAPGRAVAILPAGDLAVRRITAPGRSEREAKQAAPFLIEEDLAAPLEETDIAVGPRLEDGSRWALAASSEARAAWRRRAASFGVKPLWSAPASMLLRGHGGDLTVMRIGEDILFQTALADLGQPPEEPVTPAALRQPCGAAPAPFGAVVLPALGRAIAPRRMLISEDIDPNLLAPEGEPIALRRAPAQDLRANAAALADEAFAVLPAFFGDAFLSALDWGALLKPWRRAAVMAAAALIGATVLLRVEAAYLDARAELYREASQSAFREAFPETRRVVNPQVQLRQRLAALGGAVDGGGFLPLVSALAGILEDVEAVRIDGLRYDGQRGALVVSAVYSDFADFEALRAAAEARSVAIEDAGARQSSEGISGDFILSLP